LVKIVDSLRLRITPIFIHRSSTKYIACCGQGFGERNEMIIKVKNGFSTGYGCPNSNNRFIKRYINNYY
jgi:hypothetical protein